MQVDIETRGGLLLFDVMNIGRRPAINVNVTLNPEPVSQNPRFQASLRAVFNKNHVIEMIAPGKRLQWFVDVSNQIVGSSVPRSYEATVKYDELPVKGRKTKSFVEHHKLSFAQYEQSALPEAGLAQLVDAARNIASKIENLKSVQERYGTTPARLDASDAGVDD